MIVIGLILLVIVVAIAITLIISGNDPVSVNLFGTDIDTTARNLYLSGAASLLVAVIALWLIRKGARRAHQLRKENKSLKREVRSTRDSTPDDPDVDEQFKTTPKE